MISKLVFLIIKKHHLQQSHIFSKNTNFFKIQNTNFQDSRMFKVAYIRLFELESPSSVE